MPRATQHQQILPETPQLRVKVSGADRGQGRGEEGGEGGRKGGKEVRKASTPLLAQLLVREETQVPQKQLSKAVGFPPS